MSLEAASTRPLPARTRGGLLRRVSLWQSLAAVLLACLWEGAVRAGWVDALYLPPPTAIVESFGPLLRSGQLLHHGAVTLAEFALGWGASVLAGIGLGLFLALVPWAGRFAAPFVSAAMSVPKVAVVPLLALWLGIGFGHKVAIVFLFAVFPVLYSTQAGVRQVRAEHLKVARAFGAGTLQTVWKVILPSAVPAVFAALRVSASVGLVGALFAEMLASKEGLGNLITRSTATLDTATTFALVIVVTALAVGMVALLDAIERLFFQRWLSS